MKKNRMTVAAFGMALFFATVGWADGSNVTVHGTVVLGGYGGDNDSAGPVPVAVRVALWRGNTLVLSVPKTLDGSGEFTIDNVTPGPYNVAVKAYAHLQKVLFNVLVSDTATNLGTFELLNGDMDGTNAVDSTDLSVLLDNMDAMGDERTNLPQTILVNCGNGVTMELVKIPAGSFLMGTNFTDYSWLQYSRPVHQVTISQAFYMGKYEVTQTQYQAVMGTNPSYFTGDLNRPVERVSWNSAVAFCQALSTQSGYNIRLPSEAEWEYACKADHGNVDTKYYFGDNDSQLGTYAWYYDNSGSTTHAVGTKTANSFGLFDMSGNVWEWCQDWWHNDYTGAPTDGSAWTTGGDQVMRVFRGGSWFYYYSNFGDYRTSARNCGAPVYTEGDVGFRVVSGN